MSAAALTCGACSTEPPGPEPVGWFREVTEESGLLFNQSSGAAGGFLLPEIMGGGAALFDYDQDGDLDAYLTNGGGAGVASGAVNRMFRQESDGRFVDVTAESGLGDAGYGMGVAVGDFDNDGDNDVYVSNYGPDRLYRNDGDGTFTDVTAAAGIAVAGWSCSVAFFDYDRDGLLDLYVAQYVIHDEAKECTDRLGRPDYCTPAAFPAAHDVLLRNNGDGTFADVSERSGIRAGSPAAGLGVACADFDSDGWQDVYVANDAYANNLWHNNGDGTFRDVAVVMGTALNAQGAREAGMGVLAADLDNDGDPDLFMTHLTQETNTYYRNLGPRGFEDATMTSGLGAASTPYTGFGTAAFDIELDGDLDIVVVNGRVARGEPSTGSSLPPPWNEYAEPNLLFLNDGTGRFAPHDDVAPAFCQRAEISRGLAAGDMDNDGDIDLLVANIEGAARLYRNEAPRAGHWLSIRAVDPRLRRVAVGARVLVTAGDLRLMRTVGGGSSYLSSSDDAAHFGLGKHAAVDSVEITWPDGLRERFGIADVDRKIELRRGEGAVVP